MTLTVGKSTIFSSHHGIGMANGRSFNMDVSMWASGSFGSMGRNELGTRTWRKRERTCGNYGKCGTIMVCSIIYWNFQQPSNILEHPYQAPWAWRWWEGHPSGQTQIESLAWKSRHLHLQEYRVKVESRFQKLMVSCGRFLHVVIHR